MLDMLPRQLDGIAEQLLGQGEVQLAIGETVILLTPPVYP